MGNGDTFAQSVGECRAEEFRNTLITDMLRDVTLCVACLRVKSTTKHLEHAQARIF